MSNNEIAELIKSAEAVNKKWSIYKITAWVVGCICLIISFGIQVGDWKQWRVNTDGRISRLESGQGNNQLTSNEKSK